MSNPNSEEIQPIYSGQRFARAYKESIFLHEDHMGN